jgi:hypothetical protein
VDDTIQAIQRHLTQGITEASYISKFPSLRKISAVEIEILVVLVAFGMAKSWQTRHRQESMISQSARIIGIIVAQTSSAAKPNFERRDNSYNERNH